MDCLGLRASDTRIEGAYGLGKYTEARREHVVTVTAGDVAGEGGWCRPVRVPWPGVQIQEAAARMGRHVETVRRWLPPGKRQGREREDRLNRQITVGVDYWPTGVKGAGEPGSGQRRVWGVRYEEPRVRGKHQGAAVPMVWCVGAADPGHQDGGSGGRPGGAWGVAWETRADRYLAAVEAAGGGAGTVVLEAERVPRWRERTVRYRDGGCERREEFRGWEWVCPGLGRNGEARMTNDEGEGRGSGVEGASGGCGRRCQVLVSPVAGWTIGGYLAGRPGVAEGLEVGEVERWRPGVLVAGRSTAFGAGATGGATTREGALAKAVPGPGVLPGAGALACVRCWGVRNASLLGRSGWNDFVTRVSGGLLSGAEVPRVGVGPRVG